MLSTKKPKGELRVRVLNYIALGIFVAALVFGIVELFDFATQASGVIVILCAFVGIVLTFADRVVRHFWRANIPFSVLLIAYGFIFLATVPGEIFDFYYTVWWWDIFLHVFSGFGITLIFHRIISSLVGERKIKRQHGLVVFLAVFAALGAAVVWETVEFTLDSAFNTNMQKFIPEEFLPNNTGAVVTLQATDEQIAEYYRQPAGYRFALVDTMEDHIAFLSGSILWLLGHVLDRSIKRRRISSKL